MTSCFSDGDLLLFSDDRGLVDTRGTAEVGIPVVFWVVVDDTGTDDIDLVDICDCAVFCEDGEGEEGGNDGGEEIHGWG